MLHRKLTKPTVEHAIMVNIGTISALVDLIYENIAETLLDDFDTCAIVGELVLGIEKLEERIKFKLKHDCWNSNGHC